MACSKVVRTFRSNSENAIQWSIMKNDCSTWIMCASHDYICVGCRTQKPDVLNFLAYNCVFCLDCLEHVFALTVNFETQHVVLKTQKADLKKQIVDEKVKSSTYYMLKSQLNEIKAKQMNLKKFANVLVPTTPLRVPLTTPPAAVKKTMDDTRAQWSFFGKQSELCSNLNGSCKRCNETCSVFIHGEEDRVAFCVNCIRVLFSEMKPTKEDYEKELTSLKQNDALEDAKYQKSKKTRQDKMDQMQTLITKLE